MPEPTFHPELRRAARMLPRGPIGPRAMPWVRRLERLAGRRRAPSDVAVERVGAVEVRLHRPPAATGPASPALLWIHGGGYVTGLAAQDDRLCRQLAAEVGVTVAAVEYRRAPEHPYPAAVRDCHDALVWLASRPDIDERRLAIGGASAGGGLAAALAHLARERGEVHPAFQLLVYPMLDDRTALRTDVDERGFRLWTNRSNHFGWSSYLGMEPGAPGVEATAVPARADDVAGLPPAWIGVGTLDLFHDEDLAYAERLRAAGVPCEVSVVDGAFHGFNAAVPKAGVSRAFQAEQVAALTAAFGATV
jgi:acetyl esterase/lipase